MSVAAKKPNIEIRRKLGVGHYRTYATVYWWPLSVWVRGHWLIGGRRVRKAWEEALKEQGGVR